MSPADVGVVVGANDVVSRPNLTENNKRLLEKLPETAIPLLSLLGQ